MHGFVSLDIDVSFGKLRWNGAYMGCTVSLFLLLLSAFVVAYLVRYRKLMCMCAVATWLMWILFSSMICVLTVCSFLIDRSSKSPAPIQILSQARDSVTGVETLQHVDGEALIRTCSVDGIVRTYDLRKGILQEDNVDNAIFSMALTHDAQCLAISCLDGTIRLMEAETGELLNTYSKHHVAGNYALSCNFTADDAHVVTGSEDGRVVLYDLVRGEMVQELLGHLKPTCSVASHPLRQQSSIVISASYDGSAIVWANDSSYIQYT
jgi:mitogen-activated protein kinase organizer 1